MFKNTPFVRGVGAEVNTSLTTKYYIDVEATNYMTFTNKAAVIHSIDLQKDQHIYAPPSVSLSNKEGSYTWDPPPITTLPFSLCSRLCYQLPTHT